MGIRKVCYELYWKLERLIVPGLRNSQYVYKEKLEALVTRGTRWLELGCGHQILPDWMRGSRQIEAALVNKAELVVGLDPTFESVRYHPTINARVVANIEDCPFDDASFSVVTANMVMEHVQDPRRALAEVNRILKPGGIFLFHTTNSRNYQFALSALLPQSVKNKVIGLLEGRREEDVFPTAYKVNTPREISEISKHCGFSILELNMVNSTAAAIVLLPLAVLELMAIRLLQCKFAEKYRSNIIVLLQKAGLA